MRFIGRSGAGRLARQESGYALVMSILVFIIMLILGIAIIVTGFQEINLSARTRISEEAYSIAEAGINRAAMELQTNADLRNMMSPVFPSPLQTPKTENFTGGGNYTWSVYQNEQAPDDYRAKVIRSLGKITRAGRTAERMIETRVIVDVPGEGYDASFDYLIYNGMNDTGGMKTWYPGRWFNSGSMAGDYTYDGSTEYLGRRPKGAIYTKGGIKLPVSVFGDLVIKGNTVAEDIVDIQNTWHSDWNDPGVYIPAGSKVIAGLDGTGSAFVKAVATGGGITSSIRIDGDVIASDDVTVTATANVGLRETLRIGGIKAGRDVNVKGTVNISGGLSIGNIVSGRMTDIRSRWLSGITVSNIRSGQGRDSASPDRDGEDAGTGVYLDSVAASRITAANIVSTGKVHAYARVAGVSTTAITAGDDYGLLMGNTGTGVKWDISWLGGTSIGDITSRGMVDLQARNVSTIECSEITAGSADFWGSQNATGVIFRGTGLSTIDTRGGSITSRGDVLAQVTSGSNITTGAITCGRNVDLNCGEWVLFNDDMTINGPVAAAGYVNLTTGDTVTVNGSITSGSWIRAWSTANYLSGSGANHIYVYGDVSAGSDTIPGSFPAPVQGPGEVGRGSGWSVYIDNTNDFPGPADNLTVSGSVSAVGQVTVRGNDDVRTGDIRSNGNVLVTWSLPFWGSSNAYYLGNIHAGGYVKVYTDAELTGSDDSINTGAITAGSYVELEGHDEIRVGGSILANGNVKLESTYKDITAGNPVEVFGGIRSRGHVRIFQDVVEDTGRVNNGIWANSVDVRKTSWIWPWESNFRIGNIGDGPNQDSIRAAAGGGVRSVWVTEENGGEISLGDGGGDIRMQTGSQSPSINGDVSYRGNQYSSVSLPATVSGPGLGVPAVSLPSLPAKPAVPTVTRNAGGDIDVLNEAGLEGLVNLLMPNWEYFRDSALEDDASVNPDPTAGPNPPHVIVDNGPGDYDSRRNYIEFRWAPWGTSAPYSTNETVYVDSLKDSWNSGDPEYERYCEVIIKSMNWSGEEPNFQGTLVTKGHVDINVGNASDWELNSTQTLNVVAGGDIKVSCGGVTNFALWKNNESHLHFWAYHDIDLENTTLSLTGDMTYYGSFTAGNQVKLADNNFWPDTTLKWSRWALDPVAWVPPFEVLTWKEL